MVHQEEVNPIEENQGDYYDEDIGYVDVETEDQQRVIPRQTTGKKLNISKNASNFLYHLYNLNDDLRRLLLAILTNFWSIFDKIMIFIM